jgi:hypothetical protein
MVLTAVALIVGLLLSGRSQIAYWMAFPVLVAGCTLAFDLSHAVALFIGKNHT